MLHAKKQIHKFPYLNSWMPDAHFGAADSWWKTGLPVVSCIHLHQETQRGPLRELFPDGGMDGFTGVVQLIVTWQKICSLNGSGKLEIDPHDDVDGDDDGDGMWWWW